MAGGQEVSVTETTGYPFKETIRFTFQTKTKTRFPFHLRIPEWCKNPILSINGIKTAVTSVKNIVVTEREWTDGDQVELSLPMDFRYSYWYENSLGIERGPLVYALKIEEEWREVTKAGFDNTFWEVLPKSPWNYSLVKGEIEKNKLQVEVKSEIADNPWNLKNAPISVTTKGKRMPMWGIERASAGKIPSPSWPPQPTEKQEEEIILIPYGCTTLRIAEFPVN